MVSTPDNSTQDLTVSGNRIIFFLPLILLAVFIAFKIACPDFYDALILEDSPIECIQCILFFLAIPFTVSISRRLLKTGKTFTGFLYICFSLCLLLVTLEELSWGQRIFHLKCPVFFEEHND